MSVAVAASPGLERYPWCPGGPAGVGWQSWSCGPGAASRVAAAECGLLDYCYAEYRDRIVGTPVVVVHAEVRCV